MLNRVITSIIFLIIISLALSDVDIENQIQVVIQNNTYIGFKNTVFDKNVNSFLGIPYAEPPINQLRYKKSLPVPTYGTIDATKFRNCCPQRKHGLFGNSSTQSEDCLYLNIWNAGEHIDLTELKPVMLYIHGGSWTEGESSDGSILAVTGDVVVITINYRLGFIGFLYTGTDDAPGNAGLWDQVLALEWVNDNIAYFGGDPQRITLFGESVGSRSTSIHILSPLTRNLFKNAIMMSGSSLSHLSHSEPQVLLNTSLIFSKLVGCNRNDENQFTPEIIECLKQLPLDKLIEAQASRQLWTQRFGFSSNYIHGDQILPETPKEMLDNGDYKKNINLLISTVEDEGTWILYRMDQNKYSRTNPVNLSLDEAYEQLKEYANSIDTTPAVNGEQVADLYFNNKYFAQNNSYELLKTIGIALGDFFISCPTIKFAKQLFDFDPKRNKIYEMYWTSKEGEYCAQWHGSCHASDFEAVFGRAFRRKSSDIEKQVSLRLMKVFAYFAKYDHPPPEDGQQWVSYHMENGNSVKPYYELSSHPKIGGNYGFNLKEEECERLWNQYF